MRAALATLAAAILLGAGVVRADDPEEVALRKDFTPASPHYTGPSMDPTDGLAEVASGTALLDWKARPVEGGAGAITLAGGEYETQAHPVLPIAGSSDVLVYVWGVRGRFLEGGKPAASLSGFIRRSAITRVVRGVIGVRPDKLDRVDHAELAQLTGKYKLRHVSIHAERTSGTYSSASHPLSDYGWAHDRLPRFCYGAMNLPGWVHSTAKTRSQREWQGGTGGVTGLVFQDGDEVLATKIAVRVTPNEPNLDARSCTFVLCEVALPRGKHEGSRERMAVWVALANLPGVKVSELEVEKH